MTQRRYQKAERAGKLAELLICLLYMVCGARLVYWRRRTAYGEIDLVMKRGKMIRFIEVKYWRQYHEGDRFISDTQLARLRNAAFITYHQLSSDSDSHALNAQCDIILVQRFYHIRRFENYIPLYPHAKS